MYNNKWLEIYVYTIWLLAFCGSFHTIPKVVYYTHGESTSVFSVCIFAEFSTQIPNPGTNGPEVKSLHSGHVLKFCIFAIFNISKTVKHINNSSFSARVYPQWVYQHVHANCPCNMEVSWNLDVVTKSPSYVEQPGGIGLSTCPCHLGFAK